MNHNTIHRDISIADLTEQHPQSVAYLSDKGIRCIRCGEPIWGTLAEAAREKGFSDDEINTVVEELQVLTKSK